MGCGKQEFVDESFAMIVVQCDTGATRDINAPSVKRGKRRRRRRPGAENGDASMKGPL
jgi:hypothetical protein